MYQVLGPLEFELVAASGHEGLSRGTPIFISDILGVMDDAKSRSTLPEGSKYVSGSYCRAYFRAYFGIFGATGLGFQNLHHTSI